MKKLMHFLLLSCLKATRLIEKKLYIRLSLKERIQLKLHKSMCNACRLYDKQTHIIDEVLKTKKPEFPNIDIETFKLHIKDTINK